MYHGRRCLRVLCECVRAGVTEPPPPPSLIQHRVFFGSPACGEFVRVCTPPLPSYSTLHRVLVGFSVCASGAFGSAPPLPPRSTTFCAAFGLSSTSCVFVCVYVRQPPPPRLRPTAFGAGLGSSSSLCVCVHVCACVLVYNNHHQNMGQQYSVPRWLFLQHCACVCAYASTFYHHQLNIMRRCLRLALDRPRHCYIVIHCRCCPHSWLQ